MRPVAWMRSLFRRSAERPELPVMHEPPASMDVDHRPRLGARHDRSRKWWARRKSRMRMARESRRRNR